MKTIYLVRHAKSSWDSGAESDFERPLNDRGKRDAPMMAKRLQDKDIKIDAFVSSPAKRAKKTAEVFVKEYNQDKDNIIFIDELYHAGPEAFSAAIEKLKNKYKRVAIFSHNPGITEFANSLTDTRVDDMPTCSIFAVSADTDDWEKFREAKKEFLFFEYPKAYGGDY